VMQLQQQLECEPAEQQQHVCWTDTTSVLSFVPVDLAMYCTHCLSVKHHSSSSSSRTRTPAAVLLSAAKAGKDSSTGMPTGTAVLQAQIVMLRLPVFASMCRGCSGARTGFVRWECQHQ
jgi:hypothetical protein